MIDQGLHYRLAMSRIKGVNVSLAQAWIDKVGGVEPFFSLPESTLAAAFGFASKAFSQESRRKALDEGEQERKFVESNGVKTLFFTEASYPSLLRECDDAPVTLSMIGDCDFAGAKLVGIVGTRHATAYGQDFTAKLVADLATRSAEKVVIVSGLAYGVDVAAHKAALDCGLSTVAVLAHGLKTIYPASHRSIAASIAGGHGALLTEYFSTDPVHRGNFLARNRIVAGLCDCLVVVESDVKGGALFTARLASEYNREVFALPGRVTDRFSRGCNRLIERNMARLLPDPSALLDEMGWPQTNAVEQQRDLFADLSPLELQVTDLLGQRGEVRLEELRYATGQTTARLMALMVELDTRGLVMSIPGGRYRLASN